MEKGWPAEEASCLKQMRDSIAVGEAVRLEIRKPSSNEAFQFLGLATTAVPTGSDIVGAISLSLSLICLNILNQLQEEYVK